MHFSNFHNNFFENFRKYSGEGGLCRRTPHAVDSLKCSPRTKILATPLIERRTFKGNFNQKPEVVCWSAELKLKYLWCHIYRPNSLIVMTEAATQNKRPLRASLKNVHVWEAVRLFHRMEENRHKAVRKCNRHHGGLSNESSYRESVTKQNLNSSNLQWQVISEFVSVLIRGWVGNRHGSM